VAENSGGVHCLKYGVTTNNVLGCELVLMSGEILRLGGSHLDAAGYDLLGVVNGSEGLLGVITEVTVRILKKPECARAALIGFASSEDAGECVARIIGAGIIPGGSAPGTIAISGSNNATAANSHGIVGVAGSGHGLIGNTNFTGGGPPYYAGLVGNAPNGAYAGLFFGKVQITGTLNGNAKFDVATAGGASLKTHRAAGAGLGTAYRRRALQPAGPGVSAAPHLGGNEAGPQTDEHGRGGLSRNERRYRWYRSYGLCPSITRR